MKRFQSVLCSLALALSLSSTVLAGNIHGVSASGNIHGVKANNSDLLTWSDVTGMVVSIFGNIHGI